MEYNGTQRWCSMVEKIFLSLLCVTIFTLYATPHKVIIFNDFQEAVQLFLPAESRQPIPIEKAVDDDCPGCCEIDFSSIHKLDGCKVPGGIRFPAIQTKLYLYLLVKRGVLNRDKMTINPAQFCLDIYKFPRTKIKERLKLSELEKIRSFDSGLRRIFIIIQPDGTIESFKKD